MQFNTKIEIPRSVFPISHQDKIILMGSCFIENIGKKLISSKFDVQLNPFGILYNPLSISQALNRLIGGNPFSEKELFQDKGVYHSFWHHSRFSALDKATCLNNINTSFDQAQEYLKESELLIITFGTANIYRLSENGMVVGNCHKLPASTFCRERLNVADIVTEWELLLDKLYTLNHQIKILFTVSPIRHLKDGAHENQLSKSTLLLAIDELCAKYNNLYYFPSYEIVLDELRDYRFYAEDMLHPSETAVDYIWQRFTETYFSKETTGIMEEWRKIALNINHKPFNPHTEEYKHFLKLTLDKINLFKKKYPYICCYEEVELLNKKFQEI